MTFKIDYRDGDVIEWSVTDEGAVQTRISDYTPTFYVAGDSRSALEEAREHIQPRPEVASTAFESWSTVWRNTPEPVLRVDVTHLDLVTDLASEIRGWGTPGEYTLYNVDFAREFRYCLTNDITPLPDDDARELTHLEISVPAKAVSDESILPLQVDGATYDADAATAIEHLWHTLRGTDPDVLVLSESQLVPLLHQEAMKTGFTEFRLGRLPGWQQLAEQSTFESYGRVGHSPARYNVPGRAIIDVSNSFFWGQTNLDGLLDLVRRSAKPLQETAWASIGNVLTSIQIRHALENDVLVPWNSWRHEKFKPMVTLHEADRGGFIFSPEVGFHEDVHELDFSSLYPNIMITRNVSPDVIRCDCHGDREDVPGLGYSICDEQGFIVDVLSPIVNDREAYKAEIDETTDSERESELRGRSEALKWILVSCFGYQGFSNAKFGRIECHEAINAFAREILLDTKEILEEHGWHVIHGIVDSVWVQAMPGESQTPLEEVAALVTDEIGITLDYEAHYDWIAFVPRKDSNEGALNRYFAKTKDEESYKKRGIEIRQRSTPQYIESCQEDMLRVLDEHRSPEPVCDRLALQLQDLHAGRVDPADLYIKRRVSKSVEEYSHYTRNVAALERAAGEEFEINPGENVRYVVVDDEKNSQARVMLPFEDPNTYDADFYGTLLIRAAENIVSPFGWRRDRIRRYLDETKDTKITAY